MAVVHLQKPAPHAPGSFPHCTTSWNPYWKRTQSQYESFRPYAVVHISPSGVRVYWKVLMGPRGDVWFNFVWVQAIEPKSIHRALSGGEKPSLASSLNTVCRYHHIFLSTTFFLLWYRIFISHSESLHNPDDYICRVRISGWRTFTKIPISMVLLGDVTTSMRDVLLRVWRAYRTLQRPLTGQWSKVEPRSDHGQLIHTSMPASFGHSIYLRKDHRWNFLLETTMDWDIFPCQ